MMDKICKTCLKEFATYKKEQEYCCISCGLRSRKKENISLMSREMNGNIAYIIGMVFTDGCLVYNKKYNIPRAINISNTCSQLVIDIRDYIDRELAISSFQPKRGNMCYAINLNNSADISSFMDIGLIRAKSNTKPFPQVEDEYFWHMVRGIFDGDGCVYSSKIVSSSGREHFYPNVRITSGSLEFSIGLNEQMKSRGVESTITFDCRNGEERLSTTYVSIQNKVNINKFYDRIYEDKSLYMVKKFEKFSSMI